MVWSSSQSEVSRDRSVYCILSGSQTVHSTAQAEAICHYGVGSAETSRVSLDEDRIALRCVDW